LQQQINLIRRFLSNVQTPDSVITQQKDGNQLIISWTLRAPLLLTGKSC
jgi:hypothetical protein